MRIPRDVENLWLRVEVRYGSTVDVLSGSCSKSLEDFCDVGFVFHSSAIVSSVMSALSFVQAEGLV